MNWNLLLNAATGFLFGMVMYSLVRGFIFATAVGQFPSRTRIVAHGLTIVLCVLYGLREGGWSYDYDIQDSIQAIGMAFGVSVAYEFYEYLFRIKNRISS